MERDKITNNNAYFYIREIGFYLYVNLYIFIYIYINLSVISIKFI